MKKIMIAAVFITLASSSYAFELQQIRSADIKPVETAIQTAAPAASIAKQYQNLWMNVYTNPSWKEVQASDYMAGIEVRVRKVFDGQYSVNTRAEMNSEWINIYQSGVNFNLSGYYANLNMNEWGGNYNISGSLTDDNNQTRFVQVTLFKGFDSYSFSVSGMGINLNISRSSITGNYDDREYSKRNVAAILALALAVQADQLPAVKSAADTQRIWLTIRPSTGWNIVEASDPFACIKVGLHKIIDGEYEAAVDSDNEMEIGRISHFFTRNYEYRAYRTYLKLEDWAGDYTLQGEVYLNGSIPETVKISARVRETSPGSFSVSANGAGLRIDRNGVSGAIDAKVFPKKAVAIIAAIAMAAQQEIPQSSK